jgi:hypothetical protein
MVPIVLLASVAPAMAEPVFEKFKECPTMTGGVTLCTFGRTTSGKVAIGSTAVPISATITQQGGAIKTENPSQTTEYRLVAPEHAEFLSKVPLNVPGGLADLINCTEITGEGLLETTARAVCKTVFEHGLTEVTATTELVANEGNPVLLNLRNLAEEEETALILPIRVHLKNTFLGNNCFIGSASSPIELDLTTGTSGTLTGKRGHASSLEEGGFLSLHLSENALVDNTFTVPVTEGCGELLFVKGFLDSIVNSKLGLPSASGNNAAVLEGELNTASAKAVEANGF